ncbi:MAG: hypothetical protein QM730_23065 [Anaerolineales bacterium]
MKKTFLFLFTIIFLSVSCSPNAQPAPTRSFPSKTPTAIATNTVLPSPTASFTATPTPEPLGLPGGVLPQGWGLSIHYEFVGDTYFSPAESTLLNDAHIGFVRDDIWPGAACNGIPFWCFEYFDKLVSMMEQRDIRVVFNLVGHNFEQSGTEETRKAFVEFAGVAAEHFKGRGVIWELWAEPDGDWSWKPKSSSQEYALLASEAIAAMKTADPNAIILGPNVATLDTVYGDNPWRFLEAVGETGVLTKFDAVNIHLHNGGDPETQIKSLLRLRRLIDSYSPDRKIPITSSEWGYTNGGKFYNLKVTPEQQAQYLVRSWLVNASHEINLSIWYDWKDDTWGEMEEYDRHFGIITGTGELKPAYTALKTLTTTLDGYQFVRRITTESSKDYLLLFRKGSIGILVGWTTDDSHTLTISNGSADLKIVDMMGADETLPFDEKGIMLSLSASPQYILLPDGLFGNESIFWKPDGTFFRLDEINKGEIPLTIENPFDQEQTYDIQAVLDGEKIGNLQVKVTANQVKSLNLPIEMMGDPNVLDHLVQIIISNQGSRQTGSVWVQK